MLICSLKKLGGNLLIGKEFQNSENETPGAFHFSEPDEIFVENFVFFEIRAVKAVVRVVARLSGCGASFYGSPKKLGIK